MTDYAKITTALVFTALLITSGVGTVVAQSGDYPLNPDASDHPDTYIQEDELTVETHNRTTMGWLEYEDDSGKISPVNAHVNGTNSSAKVEYRADHIQESDFAQFPRASSEDGNNSVSWIHASDWTESGSTISVAESDGKTAPNVESIEIATDGSLSDGSSANVAYSAPEITTDAEKRYLQFVGNVDSLESGATVEIQVRDGDGDYVAAEINSSRDATAEDVMANQTASGVIYQEQLGQLDVEGTGDGSLDAIQEVRVVTTDGDATVTITGLNVEKKSTWDFGSERVPDTSTDDSDDYTSQEVRNLANGGEIQAKSLQPMGDTFADSVVHDLTYLDVRYGMQDSPTASVDVEFVEAEQYPNFPVEMELTWNRTISTAYDLSHGSLSLHTEQTFLTDRYNKLRYAEGTGDTNVSDISDSEWIDLTGSLGTEGQTISADSSVQPDTTYVVQMDVLLQDEQQQELEASSGGGGFWGGSSGGGNPFSSLINWVAGGVVGLLGMFGLRRRM